MISHFWSKPWLAYASVEGRRPACQCIRLWIRSTPFYEEMIWRSLNSTVRGPSLGEDESMALSLPEHRDFFWEEVISFPRPLLDTRLLTVTAQT